MLEGLYVLGFMVTFWGTIVAMYRGIPLEDRCDEFVHIVLCFILSVGWPIAWLLVAVSLISRSKGE